MNYMKDKITEYRDIKGEIKSTVNINILKKVSSDLVTDTFENINLDYMEKCDEFILHAGDDMIWDKVACPPSYLNSYYNALGLCKLLTDITKFKICQNSYKISMNPRRFVPIFSELRNVFLDIASNKKSEYGYSATLKSDIDELIGYFYSFLDTNWVLDNVIIESSIISDFKIKYANKKFIHNREYNLKKINTDNITFITEKNLYYTQSYLLNFKDLALTRNKSFFVYLHILSLFTEFIYFSTFRKNMITSLSIDGNDHSIFSVMDSQSIRYLDILSTLSNIITTEINLHSNEYVLNLNANHPNFVISNKIKAP